MLWVLAAVPERERVCGGVDVRGSNGQAVHDKVLALGEGVFHGGPLLPKAPSSSGSEHLSEDARLPI